jgi:hypothetical protein
MYRTIAYTGSVLLLLLILYAVLSLIFPTLKMETPPMKMGECFNLSGTVALSYAPHCPAPDF